MLRGSRVSLREHYRRRSYVWRHRKQGHASRRLVWGYILTGRWWDM